MLVHDCILQCCRKVVYLLLVCKGKCTEAFLKFVFRKAKVSTRAGIRGGKNVVGEDTSVPLTVAQLLATP